MILKNRECLLYYLQHGNDKPFTGDEYTHNMINLYVYCYFIPTMSNIVLKRRDELSKYPYDELFMWSFTLFSGKKCELELMQYYWSLSSHPIACCIAICLLCERLENSFYVSDNLKLDLTELRK